MLRKNSFKNKNAPIGTEIPEPPKRIIETIDQKGTVNAINPNSATRILLPIYWSEGNQTVEMNSLIWISKTQYQEPTLFYQDKAVTLLPFFWELRLVKGIPDSS
jgi:hypothetical protein